LWESDYPGKIFGDLQEMDTMELRSGKTLGETAIRGDSEDDFEEEVPASLDGYATGGIEKERRVSSFRIESMDTAPRP